MLRYNLGMASTQVKAGSKQDLMFQTLYPSAPQKVTITSSSTQSSAFSANVSVIRIFPTSNCYVKFGSNPTATTSDIYCPGGILQFFGVIPGEKVAVIQDTASGTLHVVEGAVV